MIYGLGWTNWLRLIVWLVIGLTIYFGYSRKHSKLQSDIENGAAGEPAQSMAD
jgi:APA family basic amino acid/polyamine antiporter